MNDKNKPICGLVWPSSGYPSYYCIVSQKHESPDKTFESTDKEIEIIKEGEFKLKDLKDMKCKDIYTDSDARNYTFIRDFKKWRHDKSINIRLHITTSSSFEASILQIKQYILDKKLIFPFDSLIKKQLSVFSKASLEREVEFYAVRSLCMVVGQFGKNSNAIEKPMEEPKLKKWW